MSNFASVVWGSLWGFIGGVFAWFATNYYGQNLLRFWDQRLEIYKALRTPESSRLLELASELDGLEAIMPRPLHCLLRICGYDLGSAAHALKGLSELQDADIHEIAESRVQVQDFLLLRVDPEDRERAERWRRIKNATS